jgi:hypothetical protein
MTPSSSKQHHTHQQQPAVHSALRAASGIVTSTFSPEVAP